MGVFMRVLSLFDGMSCGRIALDRAGINVTSYHASELDKHAIKVTQANWPETVQLGDVTLWREWDIDWKDIDLLIGGSPCQGFSFAGKQAGTTATLDGSDIMVTTREIYLDAKAKGAVFHSQSYLFWEYVLCLDHIKLVNPDVKFMLENVKMKKELLQMISDTLGVNPVFINSALVSAQNRQRYYWASWKIEQPEDRGILLADVLESDFVDRDKSHCLDANYYKGGNLKSYFEKHRRQLVFLKQKPRGNNKGFEKEVSKSPTISANSWEHNNHVKSMYIHGVRGPQTLDDGKAYSLTATCAAGGKALVSCKIKVIGMADDKKGHEIQRRIHSTMGKSPTLLASNTGGAIPPKIQTTSEPPWIDAVSYRKLTPIECERLQTVPDNYTNHVSNTQRYKMLGNGWTVDVIAHIFSTM